MIKNTCKINKVARKELIRRLRLRCFQAKLEKNIRLKEDKPRCGVQAQGQNLQAGQRVGQGAGREQQTWGQEEAQRHQWKRCCPCRTPFPSPSSGHPACLPHAVLPRALGRGTHSLLRVEAECLLPRPRAQRAGPPLGPPLSPLSPPPAQRPGSRQRSRQGSPWLGH